MWITGTLPLAALRWDAQSRSAEEHILDQVGNLDCFLLSVEKRAFRIARIAVRNDDDALDIVQDSMLQLARNYAARPSDEWRPLFYRILQNHIRDCQRRRKVRSKVFSWLPSSPDDDMAIDPLETTADHAPPAVQQLMAEQALEVLERALASLPGRQQQAFLLRNFEGLDVAQTATAMSCSQGSVKTHYSRAVHALRVQLGDVW
jgi:RNA polymerase sigma-70 factor (ECF subfamily)